MFLEGNWDSDALIRLGANRVRELPDGVDVLPDDLDITGYDAALAAVTKDRLKAYAAAKRWDVESGGTTYDLGGGVIAPVPTDRDGRAALKQARDMLRDGELLDDAGQVRIDADVVMGDFSATLDEATLTELIKRAGQHVQAAFSVQKYVNHDIDAETVTTIAEIDAAAWPA